MQNQKYLDVLIIGGGPAGSAAALTLLNQTSLNVGIVEPTDYTDMRVGESVSPSILSLMRYLGIESEFTSSKHLPSHGIDTAWGTSQIRSRDFFFTGHGHGWNLDRQKFDKMMASAIKKRNGSLLTSTKIISHKKDKNGWLLEALRKDGTKFQINSDFVIDASGKRAFFARNLGSKWNVLDYLVGIATLYEIKKTENEYCYTLLESTLDGWWYSTQIPNNKRIVVFMTDSDIAKRIKIQKQANWEMAIKKTLHIQKTINGAKKVSGPNLFPAYSQIIKKTNHTGWVPAGDAAASFDPLSSMGIGHAIVSGIQAARVAHSTLKSNGLLLSWYFEQITENFEQYLKNRSHFYSYEKRWKDSPFWKRRHTKPDLSFSVQAES